MLLTSGFSRTESSGSVVLSTANAGNQGTSGSLALATGRSNLGRTGPIELSTGNAVGGGGGDISLSVGTGVGDDEYGGGGSMNIEPGEIRLKSGDVKHSNATGGSIRLETGKNERSSSGSFHVSTADAGSRGITGGRSGDVTFGTGNAERGDSGSVRVMTGDSKEGAGGDFRVRVGQANGKKYGKKGGGISLSAGETTARGAEGGDVLVQAGEGSNNEQGFGGSGGSVSVIGGASQGAVETYDSGGDGECFLVPDIYRSFCSS